MIHILTTLFGLFFRGRAAQANSTSPAFDNGATESPIWTLDQPIADTRFTWRQALTQGRTGKIAVPTQEQEQMIIRQAKLLEPVFDLIGGFYITSWLRTPEHNHEVGGATHSTHLLGAATDFMPIKLTVEEAKERIRKSKAYPGGMEINTTTWVHLDFIHKKDFFA